MMGEYDRDDQENQLMMKHKQALYDEASVPPSQFSRQDYVSRGEADYSYVPGNQSADRSELYHARSDAQMDPGTPRSNVRAQQQYFENEHAVYSREGQREKGDAEDYVERKSAVYSQLNDVVSRVGSERQFIAQEDAARGETQGRRTHLTDDTQQFIARQDASFDNANAGPIERQATPLEYFDHDAASRGAATDVNRSRMGEQIDHVQNA